MAGLTAAIAPCCSGVQLPFLAQRLGEIERHAEQKDDGNHRERSDDGDVRLVISGKASKPSAEHDLHPNRLRFQQGNALVFKG